VPVNAVDNEGLPMVDVVSLRLMYGLLY